jgi:5-methylcytosine-specific restriction protein A
MCADHGLWTMRVMLFDLDSVSDVDLRREKEKARRLRRTDWWQRRVQKGVCYYCQRQVGLEQLTMDHVVPLSRGGKSKKGNIVPACKECNNKKRYMLPIEWEEYLESLTRRSGDI